MLTSPPLDSTTDQFHLTPEIAKELYTILCESGFDKEIKIDKQPDKIKKALDLFKIKGEFLNFFSNRGYIFKNFTSEIKNELKNLEKAKDTHSHQRAKSFFLEKLSAIKIYKLQSFTNLRENCSDKTKSQAILSCDPQILECFRECLKDSPILGTPYFNPYLEKIERFPSNATELSARHLQILARNQVFNTDGLLHNRNYRGLIDEATQGLICFLVKFTTVSGIVEAYQYGGFPPGSPLVKINPPKPTIILDQAGFQWQDSLFNSGSIFFYPSIKQNPEFENFQNTAYQAIFKCPRPSIPSAYCINITWKCLDQNLQGVLDLEAFKKAIAIEYIQAFIGVAWQSKNLPSDSKVNFRYLKAGMGFFSSGITGLDPYGKYTYPTVANALIISRLEGILMALTELQNNPHFDKGKIKALELPFSMEAGTDHLIDCIRNITCKIGLNFISDSKKDALHPSDEYFIATTNTGDPFAFVGNEGEYQSVDGMFPENCYNLQILNPAFNSAMQIIIANNLSFASHHQLPPLQNLSPESLSPVENAGQHAAHFRAAFSQSLPQIDHYSETKKLIINFLKTKIPSKPCDWFNPFSESNDVLFEIGTTRSTNTRSMTFIDESQSIKYQLYLDDSENLKLKKINSNLQPVDVNAIEERYIYNLIKENLFKLLNGDLTEQQKQLTAAYTEIRSDLKESVNESDQIEFFETTLQENIVKITSLPSALYKAKSLNIDESLNLYFGSQETAMHHLILISNSKSYICKHLSEINEYEISEKQSNEAGNVIFEKKITNLQEVIHILQILIDKTSYFLLRATKIDENLPSLPSLPQKEPLLQDKPSSPKSSSPLESTSNPFHTLAKIPNSSTSKSSEIESIHNNFEHHGPDKPFTEPLKKQNSVQAAQLPQTSAQTISSSSLNPLNPQLPQTSAQTNSSLLFPALTSTNTHTSARMSPMSPVYIFPHFQSPESLGLQLIATNQEQSPESLGLQLIATNQEQSQNQNSSHDQESITLPPPASTRSNRNYSCFSGLINKCFSSR